jgi:hypothetical protein
MKGSLEERMIQLQQSKAALGKSSFEKVTQREQRQARLTAVKDLFQISDAGGVLGEADWDHTLDDDADDSFIVESDEEEEFGSPSSDEDSYVSISSN